MILCVSCFLTSCIQYKELTPINREYTDIRYTSNGDNYSWRVSSGYNSYITIRDSVEYKEYIDVDNKTIRCFKEDYAGVNWEITCIMWLFMIILLVVIMGLSSMLAAIFD